MLGTLLGVALTWPRKKRILYHFIYFTNRKLAPIDLNQMTMGKEALECYTCGIHTLEILSLYVGNQAQFF